jgi:RNA polymerase sigma factor (sigma-70 family)
MTKRTQQESPRAAKAVPAARPPRPVPLCDTVVDVKLPLPGSDTVADAPLPTPATSPTPPEAARAPGVQELATRMYNLVRRLLPEAQDVEAVMKNVLREVVQRPEGRRDDADLDAWLYRVAVSAALSQRQQAAARPAAPADTAPARPTTGSPAVGDREALWLLDRALMRLPSIYRDPFVLADIEGLSIARVGEALKLHPQLVKIRLHRARLLLHDALEPHLEGGVQF